MTVLFPTMQDARRRWLLLVLGAVLLGGLSAAASSSSSTAGGAFRDGPFCYRGTALASQAVGQDIVVISLAIGADSGTGLGKTVWVSLFGRSGVLRWSSRITPGFYNATTPVVSGDQLIFQSRRVRLSDDASLFSIGLKTGRLRWRRLLYSGSNYPYTDYLGGALSYYRPVLVGEAVYAVSGANARTLYAVGLADGVVRWERALAEPAATMVAFEGSLVVGAWSANISCYSLDGVRRWSKTLPEDGAAVFDAGGRLGVFNGKHHLFTLPSSAEPRLLWVTDRLGLREAPDRSASVAWGQSGRYVALVDQAGKRMSLWDLHARRAVWSKKRTGVVAQVALLAGDDFVAVLPCLCDDRNLGRAVLLDRKTGRLRHSLPSLRSSYGYPVFATPEAMFVSNGLIRDSAQSMKLIRLPLPGARKAASK